MRNNYLFSPLSALKETLFHDTDAINPKHVLSVFILGFSLIYILIPFLGYQSILPDSAQNISWGHAWAWSYNRHPPLGTWLISFMSIICVNNEMATFCASVLCLSTSLLFIYLLSKRYLGSHDAFVACVVSSFCLYYQTNFVLQFNQNSIMLPFWIMICYFLDSCIHTNRLQDWIFLAIVTAGAVLAKYESLLIIFIALVYLLWHFEYKFLFKLLMAFGLSLLLLTPHLISVIQHGFLTLEFIHGKVSEDPGNYTQHPHLTYPIKALREQLGHIAPALAILILLIKTKRINPAIRETNKVKWNYLVYLGIAPLCLVILLSLIFGLKIQPEWGFPLFSFTVPAIMSYFQLKSRTALLKPLLFMALLIHSGGLGIYMAANYFSLKYARTNNPSYMLAQEAQSYWNQFTNKPLNYVAGDENYDYYLAAYLPNRPKLLEAYSFRLSPWLEQEELKRQGFMMVIDGCNPTRNSQLKERYLAQDFKCVEVPLSNKYRQQFKTLTLMVVPPAPLT
ncbi:glycosyltransferase family 39 protein [Legionella quateirensis]|uniref:Glycosyltransferase RgtA/B/C/D-like domain-containing protein n=1 Tax=Legionella quateirensis TaxID=45072 RepID=A0A378KRW6_9GAMM|nr:glycosyltransferase family 39 protein [Legionella quateirensis]KTD52929.1 hypothetical protein Lqua_0762 [Legionella quateirensis]STY16341.1 Uncharacterised protein [Legionella quateirensis]